MNDQPQELSGTSCLSALLCGLAMHRRSMLWKNSRQGSPESDDLASGLTRMSRRERVEEHLRETHS
jgi:hypothetical protein